MKSVLVFTCLFALSIVGCHRASEEIRPPKIHFGQDVCDKCAMIISDERFAGAIGMRKDGRVVYLLFDDVGEMLEFAPTGYTEIAWYATDGMTREWLDAESSLFLRSDKLMTPMGTGVGAYSSQDDAKRVQQEYGGTIMSFTEIRTAN